MLVIDTLTLKKATTIQENNTEIALRSIIMLGKAAKSFFVVLLMAFIFMDSSRNSVFAKQELDPSGYSYLSQARQFFDTGMEANHKAQTFSNLMPNEDPRAARMLRDSINKATGSSNTPNFCLFSERLSAFSHPSNRCLFVNWVCSRSFNLFTKLDWV